MALTLDPTLAAAQDSASRHPICEIISAQKGTDIPFDGTYLTPETYNEYSPSSIAHSSGRLCKAYCYGPVVESPYSYSGIKYVYTDIDRTTYNFVTIQLYTVSSYIVKSVSICELTGGNIGMIILVNDTGNHVYRLLRRIVTVDGIAVSNSEIANWSHDTYTSDPWVMTIDTDSYLMVYGKQSGSNYYIYKRTSADFVTWSAESTLLIGGLTSTYRLANPSVVKLATGDLWLFFDVLESIGPSGEELTNIYYSTSTDSGGTWSNAVKLTNYTGYGEIALHPTACQKVANQLYYIYTRRVGALHMDDTATGWPTGDYSYELSFDAVNRKLYVVNIYPGGGYKVLQCVVRIDVDTWTCDKYWDSTTTPGFPSFICSSDHHVWYLNKIHDGHHIVIFCIDGNYRFIWHLDGELDVITGYYLDTQSSVSITKNVTHSIPGSSLGNINQAQVDIDNNRIYLFFYSGYIWDYRFYVGYLDLTETSDYQLHEVLSISSGFTSDEWESISDFYVDVAGGRIIVSGGSTSPVTNDGFLAAYDMATGGLLAKWSGQGVDNDFPYYGIIRPYVYGDTVYACMYSYCSGSGQSDFRGLVACDLVSQTIQYYRPSYCSDDNHVFGQPHPVGTNKLAMTHQGYGVAIFDTVSHTWELFNNDNIPGMTLSGVDSWGPAQIAYDATQGIIFVGDTYNSSGVVAFSEYGYLRQSFYSVGTYSGGSWSFSTPLQLVQGFRDFEAAAIPDPSNSTSMYVDYTSESASGEQSIKWDKDGTSLELAPYLTDDEIALSRTIDGNPASLSFSVSHGHLFDPYNQNSLLSIYLKKGRKLTIRWGEKISGVDYWQPAGVFYVVSGSISLKRGDYPVMKIEAEDERTLWAHGHVYATSIYSNKPEDILTDLMQDIAGMSLSEIDTLSIDNSVTLDHQWIETTLDEILTQICERFGYYYRFTVDGKFSVKKITNSGTVDHAYTDQTKIIEYSPDDKYSDFTNKVTVMGQERSFTTVIFAEERVGGVSGTLGWWGCSKEHKVWFSYDQSRRCVNPRMDVVETAESMPMRLAGKVHESLKECPSSADNKYCTINVEAPNLIAPLIANIIGAFSASFIPDAAILFVTIPIGRVVEATEVMICSMILGSVANYQIDVYAQPLGSVRRSVQGEAEDLIHQAEIGCVNEKKIEDSLCYSESDCNFVAAFELMIAQMQRRRIKIQKIAHLQDEDGDTISFVHPISGATVNLYITNLTRKYKKPSGPGGDDGYFLDEIEGWVVQ